MYFLFINFGFPLCQCDCLVSTTSEGCPYKGGFSPLDTSGEAVEVDQVLHYALVFIHAEIFEVGLGFTFGVMQSKVLFLT